MDIRENIIGLFGGVSESVMLQRVADANKEFAGRVIRELGTRSFEAASMSRLTEDFLAQVNEVDQDIRTGGKLLRNRSRHLAVNNAHATRAVNLYIDDVVGYNGHTFQSNIVELVEDTKKRKVLSKPDRKANALIEEKWADFCRKENCTVTRRDTYAKYQRKVGAHKFRDGEAFIRRVWDPTAKYGFRLQGIPPENIAEELNLAGRNSVIKMGIELDLWGAPIAYYVRKATPYTMIWGGSQYLGDYYRVPANDMIHLFNGTFMNQTRGFTPMAPVMLMLHWVRGYGNASVLNAKISAAKLGFFTEKDPNETTGELGTGKKADGTPTINAKAGSFSRLGKNLDLLKWDPQYPHDQHKPFMQVTLAEIASGIHESYSALSGDWSQHNFSSQRGEMEPIRKHKKAEQQEMIDDMDMVVFDWFLEGALMKNQLPSYNFTSQEKIRKPIFWGPNWDYIQPLDDIQAIRMAMESGVESPYDVAAKKNRKLEDIYQDIADAKELAEEMGITLIWGKSDIVAGSKEVAAPGTQPNGSTNGVKK